MPHNLQIVLVHPEIPHNTGSIGRTCLATGSTLHLVEPLGFEISDTKLKRAGLDYWQHLDCIRYKSLKQFLDSVPEEAPKVLFTKKASTTFYEHRFTTGSYLIFGCETKGLPQPILQTYPDQHFKIPLYDPRVRSLNLANAVGIAVYEAIRQMGY